jgi:hypothetical protein
VAEMGKACSMNREMRNAYKMLIGKPEGKTPVGRPKIILKLILRK